MVAVVTAAMTAFYMFRLMSMTFFGAYRGPAWEHAAPAAVAVAATHGVKHPADPHAHGQAAQPDHEVSHGPADTGHGHHAQAVDDHGHAGGAAVDDHGGGHGAWHGPHESPSAMTFPLMALALGAMVAGFVGVPAALWGNNAIEHFLEPSFTAEHRRRGRRAAGRRPPRAGAQASRGEHEAPTCRAASSSG